MSFSREVLVWERFLTGESLVAKLTLWTWRKVLLVAPVWLALAVFRVAISTSLTDFLASLCGLLPQYSAGTAAFVLVRRTGRLAALLRRVRRLAEALEATQRSETGRDRGMAHSAALVRAIRRVVAVYLPTGLSVLLVQQLLGAPPAPTLGEESARSHPLGHALLTINETAKWGYYAISYFVLWVLMASVLIALNAMYDELLKSAASAHGARQVLAVAVLHTRLLDLQADLKDLTFQPLLHILAGAGVVPLVNTYQLLRGGGNAFSVLTFSTLPFVFGSLSALGDGLELRSELLAQAAFGGLDVFGEPLFVSKLRSMLVARASGHGGRPSGFSMRGFGSLNLRTAFNALQRWYQYLQLLLGLS